MSRPNSNRRITQSWPYVFSVAGVGACVTFIVLRFWEEHVDLSEGIYAIHTHGALHVHRPAPAYAVLSRALEWSFDAFVGVVPLIAVAMMLMDLRSARRASRGGTANG